MKKTLALLLSVMMVLSLCACGNKKEEQESLFRGEYNALVDRLTKMNESCDHVTSMVYTIWDNVGASDFLSAYDTLRLLENEEAVELCKAAISEDPSYDPNDWKLFPADVGMALDSSIDREDPLAQLRYIQDVKEDEEKCNAILSICYEFNGHFNLMLSENETLGADIKALREKYPDLHTDQITTLNEWFIESSLYAEFAAEPSGTLNSYSSDITDYQETMSRFQKTVASY